MNVDANLDAKRLIGIRIGNIRKKIGLTQEELAAKMNIGPKSLLSGIVSK